MILRPYQREAVTIMTLGLSLKDRGVLVSPAGSGKTIIGASLIIGKRILWLAPTKEMVDQGKQACDLLEKRGVEFACYASQLDASQFDMVVLDECHRATAPSIRSILATVRHDARVLGLTATPDRPDGEDITQVIGPIFHRVDREEVRKVGGIIPAQVRWENVPGSISDTALQFAEDEYRPWMNDDQRSRILWKHVKHMGIANHEWRNKRSARIADNAISKGRSCLVLVATKKQGEAIANMMNQEAVLAHSGMRKRAEQMERMRSGEASCMIATALADEGLDIKRLSVLVMACGGKAEGRTEQRVGRIMRPMEGKPDPWCFDFMDRHHGMLISQARKRSRVYDRLEIAMG